MEGKLRLSTISHGRSGMATNTCTVAVRIYKLAYDYTTDKPRPLYTVAAPRLSQFEQFKTFVAVPGPPRFSRDHEGSSRRLLRQSESELLLMTRPNDNQSPGSVIREVSP